MSSLTLGYDPESGEPRYLPEQDRTQSTYVIGAAGSGKSGLLTNLIIQDCAAGNAVIVIDPHGDLVDDCLERLPPDCLSRTSVLDLRDEDYPFGLNVFAEAGTLTSGSARTAAVERIFHIFDVLWHDTLSQVYMPPLLKATISVFLDNPGSTLYDMLRFFREPEFRAQMLANATDPTVVNDFLFEFENRTEREKDTRAQPLVNRLRGLFVGRPLVTNILSQRHQSLNLRRSIDRREYVFIKLPTTEMKEDAMLIGMALVGQASAAVFSFADTPAAQRPMTCMYIDEAQNFMTRDVERMVSEARKYGLCLTMAHQQRDQLKSAPYLEAPTLNARTKIVFRVESGSAATMGKNFPASAGTFEPSLTAVRDLLRISMQLPSEPREFVETYLRGISKYSDIEVTVPPSIFDYAFQGTSGRGTELEKVKLANPIAALDDLFYQVMLHSDPYRMIPAGAVEGLAKGGRHGFYQMVKPSSAKYLVWQPEDFPPHLVGRDADGWHVVRDPENHQEQFLHCLFLLRMTMLYLAEHPIGKTTGSKDNVAEMLVQLPKRVAFVSGSEGAFVIKTHDTPPGLHGTAKAQRMAFLRDQTRAKYCHRREEVERQDMPANPTAQQAAAVGGIALSRSEEV